MKRKVKNKRKSLRDKWYLILCARDGEKCQICKKVPPFVYLEIDHKDGNKSNNPVDGSNYQLLCRSDNRKKDPRGKGRGKVLIQYGVSMIQREMTPEMQRNEKCEGKWRHWLYNTMKRRGRMTIREITFEGAEEVGCSPETIRLRYLPKVTSNADSAMYHRFYDEAAECDIVTFKDASAVGINPEDYFIDDPKQEVD